MLKKYSSLLLIGLIINLAFSSVAFGQDKEIKATEKIKIKIAKVGVGSKSIEVKLKDKTKVKGNITEIKMTTLYWSARKTVRQTLFLTIKLKRSAYRFQLFKKSELERQLREVLSLFMQWQQQFAC